VKNSFALILFFSATLLFAAQNAAAGPYDEERKPVLVIAGEKNCPYNCESYVRIRENLDQMEVVDINHHRQLDGYGYVVDILRAIFNKSGNKVRYKIMSDKEARKWVKAGRYTILLSRNAKLKKNKNFIFPETSIGEISNNFYTNPGIGWRFSGIDSLEMVTLGLEKDREYPDIADYIEANKSYKLRIQYSDDKDPLDANIRKLAKNRISAIYEDKYTVDYYRNMMHMEDSIIYAGQTDETRKLYLAFSTKDPHSKEYVKQFDKGLRELRQSGELQKILDKYGIKDWE